MSQIDIERGILKPVAAPTMDATNYAAGMSAMVDVINENFRRIVHSDWLKGDKGESLQVVRYPLFEMDGSGLEDMTFTDLGLEVLNVIYKDAGIDWSAVDNMYRLRNALDDALYMGGKCSCDNFFDEDEGDYSINETYGYVNLFVLYDGEVEYSDEVPPTVDDDALHCVFEGMYMYIDPRNTQLGSVYGMSNTNYVDRTTSLYGTADRDSTDDPLEWDVKDYHVLPTLYWNTTSKVFCWKIDSVYTNVSAQGVRGDTGAAARTFVTMGTVPEGYDPEDEYMQVNITDVYLPDLTETDDPWMAIGDVVDNYPDIADSLEGSLTVVWYASPFISVNDNTDYRASMTMGILHKDQGGNYYIVYGNDTDDENGNNIHFDFAKILATMSLKNALGEITGYDPDDQTTDTLRGLFIPQENNEYEATGDVHMMYDKGGDLYLHLTEVINIGNPLLNEDNLSMPLLGTRDETINIGYGNVYTTDENIWLSAGATPSYCGMFMHNQSDPLIERGIDISVLSNGNRTSHIGLVDDTNNTGGTIDIDTNTGGTINIDTIGNAVLPDGRVNINTQFTNVSHALDIGGIVGQSHQYPTLVPCVLVKIDEIEHLGTIKFTVYTALRNGITSDTRRYYFVRKYTCLDDGSTTGSTALNEFRYSDSSSAIGVSMIKDIPWSYHTGNNGEPLYLTVFIYHGNDTYMYVGCALKSDVTSGNIEAYCPHHGGVSSIGSIIGEFYGDYWDLYANTEPRLHEFLFDYIGENVSAPYFNISNVNDNKYGQITLSASSKQITSHLPERIDLHRYSRYTNADSDVLYPNITTPTSIVDIHDNPPECCDYSSPLYEYATRLFNSFEKMYFDTPVIVNYNNAAEILDANGMSVGVEVSGISIGNGYEQSLNGYDGNVLGTTVVIDNADYIREKLVLPEPI